MDFSFNNFSVGIGSHLLDRRHLLEDWHLEALYSEAVLGHLVGLYFAQKGSNLALPPHSYSSILGPAPFSACARTPPYSEGCLGGSLGSAGRPALRGFAVGCHLGIAGHPASIAGSTGLEPHLSLGSFSSPSLPLASEWPQAQRHPLCSRKYQGLFEGLSRSF